MFHPFFQPKDPNKLYEAPGVYKNANTGCAVRFSVLEAFRSTVTGGRCSPVEEHEGHLSGFRIALVTEGLFSLEASGDLETRGLCGFMQFSPFHPFSL